jgi:hypothetical protein
MKLRGIKELQASLKQKINDEKTKSIPLKAQELISALKAETPVDTGRARDGWLYRDNAIINDVEYVNELNQGTSKQAPSHFIEMTLLSQEGVKPNGVIVKSN